MKRVLLLLLFIFIVGCTTSTTGGESMEYEAEVLVETNKGSFTISLYKDTPISTANFISLVEEGFYNSLTFHRYEPGFVIQGGDPSGDGTGGSENTIELEIVGHSHTTGTVGMARSNDPNSASSQFFVNLADNTFLDSGYAVFGEVTDGMDVVESLRAGDVMEKVSLK